MWELVEHQSNFSYKLQFLFLFDRVLAIDPGVREQAYLSEIRALSLQSSHLNHLHLVLFNRFSV